MIKLSDFVMNYLSEIGVRHIFLISGGGNMHLTDSAGKNPYIDYVCPLHEQAGAMAAEGYARVKNQLGTVLVTSGPSGTNAVTGLAGAWIDSIPCLYLSGQVNLQDTIAEQPLRQMGLQEVDIVSVVKPLTKYAVMIDDPASIKYHLQKAVHLAFHGRPGPVWIDIPLNIQGALIDESKLASFTPPSEASARNDTDLAGDSARCLELVSAAQRPVILAGHGIRLAGAHEKFMQLAERLAMPVLTTWGAADLMAEDHPLYTGRPGLIGQRGANFAIQNADLVLVLGSRLSIPQTGYNFKAFAREAKIVMVDIDPGELNKKNLTIDLPVTADVGRFIDAMMAALTGHDPGRFMDWLARCKDWQRRYPVVLPEYYQQKTPVNSYVFIEALSAALAPEDVIVTDMGTSFTCTFQTFKIKAGQRLFTSSGLASMGYGLPAAIGACFANHKKRTICISGDGGLQMNIQELQTLVHHQLPLKLFVLNNEGYLAVKHHQESNFQGHYVGADVTSGVSFPDTQKVAAAYGLAANRISRLDELETKIRQALDSPGPFVCEIMMPPKQALIPRLASKLRKDGTMGQTPLEDMYPFLDRDEFEKNLLIPPFE